MFSSGSYCLPNIQDAIFEGVKDHVCPITHPDQQTNEENKALLLAPMKNSLISFQR